MIETASFNPKYLVHYTSIHHEPYVLNAEELNEDKAFIMIYRLPERSDIPPKLGFEIPMMEAWYTLFHTNRKGVRRVKVPVNYSKRRHSIVDYVIVDEWNNPLLVYVDLTILRQSKLYDSVPLYREVDGEFSVAAIRSAKQLHEKNIY